MRTGSILFLGMMLFAVAAQTAPPSFERPSENIALGAAYTLDPKPSYEHCLDPDDAKQLTDGVYTEGHFWTQQSTVGWTNAKPVIITIDLGSVKPIRGISYSTAAGVAGVEWPTMIPVLVAGEDKQFHEAGELMALSAKKGLPPKDGYAVYGFWTDALQTHARYVALAIWSQPFIFADEIEVYAGDPAWQQNPLPGEPFQDIKAFTASLAIRSAVDRRFREDIAAVRERARKEDIPKEVADKVNAALDEVANAIPGLPNSYGDHFRAILPLNDLHARIFQAQAELWRAKGATPFSVSIAKTWNPPSHIADPPPATEPSLQIPMMRNEYRSAALNLANATSEEAVFELRIGGLPPCVSVYEVAWTDTNSGRPVAAALLSAERKDDAFLIHVSPGLPRQIWLRFHTKDIASGEYQGSITLKKDAENLLVPTKLHVYPMALPDQPALHFGGWDYCNAEAMYGMTPQNRAALVAAMKEYFVDSPWATSAVMPVGEYDAAGNMTKQPDTANFDNWIQLWQGARQYCVFAAVGEKLAAFDMAAPEFDAAVKAWTLFWNDHIREKGLTPDQFALLLVDETYDPKQDAIILKWAKAIRAAETGIRIWEDPTYNDMTKANQDMIAACHVLCPNRQIFLSADQSYRDYFVEKRRAGTTLEFYACSGPVRLLDPYTYHRLQAWTCWQYGATATYFWAFGDSGGASSWNEYALKGSSYTPFFIDAVSVTPAKHAEACREGIEDYEYLLMLKKAVDDSAAKGQSCPEIDRARALLEEAPKRVNASAKALTFRWHNEAIDREVADLVRADILEALNALAPSK